VADFNVGDRVRYYPVAEVGYEAVFLGDVKGRAWLAYVVREGDDIYIDVDDIKSECFSARYEDIKPIVPRPLTFEVTLERTTAIANRVVDEVRINHTVGLIMGADIRKSIRLALEGEAARAEEKS
jgi:hypothetical protein